ncbi:hypothetical protein BGZ83_007990 [Gryganskiella cystojenkinii]|nr:hypothetical protein BGZ83_007990 [Gryganskiella cystojenkinii]
MGILDLSCLVLNGTQLLGLSLAVPESEFFNDTSNHTAVILVRLTSPFPSTLEDLQSLTVQSIWRKNLPSSRFNNMGFQCFVDPLTGIFSAVHTINLLSNTPTSSVNSSPTGGFQYNPATDAWSDIDFSLDYKWNGDPASSFVVFTWPNTSTLFHATIGNSSSVNIGMLNPGGTSQDSATFVNYFNWTLDPTLHGYPRQLAYGGDSIYQIGSIITNTNTGAQDVMITRITLNANASTFYPPSNLPVIQSNDLDQCSSVYVNLDGPDFGKVTEGTGLASVNIPFGQPPNNYREPNWKAIIGGSVAGGLVLLTLMVLALRRWCWPRWRNDYWPSLRDRLKLKLLEILTQDNSQHDLGEYGDKRVLQEDEEDEHNKLEEISMHSLDSHSDHGKILVTEDMEREMNGALLDINRAYMVGVALESHPRPNYVTILEGETQESSKLASASNPQSSSSQGHRTVQAQARESGSGTTVGGTSNSSISDNNNGSSPYAPPPLSLSRSLASPSAPPNPPTNSPGG